LEVSSLNDYLPCTEDGGVTPRSPNSRAKNTCTCTNNYCNLVETQANQTTPRVSIDLQIDGALL